jgi:RNA polymerase sigma-70 factor (ECF subfamily)
MAADTEMTLIRRAQAGDAEAFGELVERHMRRAYFAALSLVGTREDALDLSQEAFARAYRARKSIDPARPFYAWLYQILRRLCFNFVRDRRAHTQKLDAAGAWLADEAASRAAPGPAQAFERTEARRLVAAAHRTAAAARARGAGPEGVRRPRDRGRRRDGHRMISF